MTKVPPNDGLRIFNHGVHGGDTEGIDQLTGQVIDAGLKVHRVLGPGLLESAYEHCLA